MQKSISISTAVRRQCILIETGDLQCTYQDNHISGNIETGIQCAEDLQSWPRRAVPILCWAVCCCITGPVCPHVCSTHPPLPRQGSLGWDTSALPPWSQSPTGGCGGGDKTGNQYYCNTIIMCAFHNLITWTSWRAPKWIHLKTCPDIYLTKLHGEGSLWWTTEWSRDQAFSSD